MKHIRKASAILVVWLIMCLVNVSLVRAQALPAQPQISFDSFVATYHLSRDANGRSLLTTEEVILAEFPSGGNFTGITRTIPKIYQGHSVDVKILSISDKAGSPLPYKTSTDKGGNLLLNIGDPAISLYGFETFRINYQTAGVIDVTQSSNTFFLDLNGHGWNQPIGEVSGAIYLSNSLVASLQGEPSCYISYLNTVSYNCMVNKTVQNGQIVVTAKADGQLAANHGLVVKLNFKAATFTNKQTAHHILLFGLAVIILLFVLFSARNFLKKR